LKICPDISFFKKSKEFESSVETSFYNNLVHEFDGSMIENLMSDNYNDNNDSIESINFADNYDGNGILSSPSQRTSSMGSEDHSPRFDENINMQMMNISTDFVKLAGGLSYIEGFSYLKSDDIKEYIQQFGDGNKEIFKNIPHYNNFTKSFNQLDKLNGNINNLISNSGISNDKKTKKEEVLFTFSLENEVSKSEIFEKESSKIKKTTLNNNVKKDRKSKKKLEDSISMIN